MISSIFAYDLKTDSIFRVSTANQYETPPLLGCLPDIYIVIQLNTITHGSRDAAGAAILTDRLYIKSSYKMILLVETSKRGWFYGF